MSRSPPDHQSFHSMQGGLSRRTQSKPTSSYPFFSNVRTKKSTAALPTIMFGLWLIAEVASRSLLLPRMGASANTPFSYSLPYQTPNSAMSQSPRFSPWSPKHFYRLLERREYTLCSLQRCWPNRSPTFGVA